MPTKEWVIKNKEHLRAYKKMWQSSRIEQKRKYDRERYLRNRETIKNRVVKRDGSRKHWITATTTYVPIQRRVATQEERLNRQIRRRLSGRILRAVKERYSAKATGTIQLLGCSIAVFRRHMESKFRLGMTWDNIHLDHIRPCSHFDLTVPEEQRRCFHFSNYQPLFPHENQRKKDVMTLADWAMLT